MTTIVGQGTITDFTARVREDPRVIRRRILELSTEAIVSFRDIRFGVGGAAFGAVPSGLFCRGFSCDRKTSSGACGGEVGGLASPRLDADKVEEGEAEGRAGPRWIRIANPFEAYETR
ncbi:hypothetical protein COLO4_25726 [Corchorus olitorius]|uniref:Uncharacterized protein n=1 Tax=Corchorus olitorius TaxID=93759 RepID=A0A1R3I0C0_9ROSI|nr:hypothetical protein COLO4_25726 [Corchorus olitorius]